MANFPDLRSGGLDVEQLVKLGAPQGEWLEKLVGAINANTRSVYDPLRSKGLGLENLGWEYVADRFSHGVQKRVALRTLARAGSCIVASVADGHAVVGTPAVQTSLTIPAAGAKSYVNVTLNFADPTAKNIQAALIFVPEGVLNAAVRGSAIGAGGTPAKGSLLVGDGSSWQTQVVGSDTQVLTADSTQPNGIKWAAGGSGSASWKISTKPTSADSRDDEFEGASHSNWALINPTLSGTAIDLLADFATANTFRESYNSMRPSWWMFQPSQDASIVRYRKSVTLNNDDFIYARVSFNRNFDNNTNAMGAVGFDLRNAASSDGIALYVNLSTLFAGSANPAITLYTTAAGVFTAVAGYTLVTTFGGATGYTMPTCVTIGLRKSGTTFYAFVATDDGSWVYFGKGTKSFTCDSLDIVARNNTPKPADIRNPIVGLDYVRFVSGGAIP